jgi:hypothetical protein
MHKDASKSKDWIPLLLKASLERYDHSCKCTFVTKMSLDQTLINQQASKSLSPAEQSKRK